MSRNLLSRMLRLVNRFILVVLRRLPAFPASLGLRAYRKFLVVLGRRLQAQTYFGATILADPRDLLQATILLVGSWEPGVSRVLEKRLKSGDVFVDVGANVGYHSLLASSIVGREGRVVAIEASSRAFALMQDNLSLNPGSSNVRPVRAAVHDRQAILPIFEVWEDNIGAASTLASRGGELLEYVEAYPLWQLLSDDEASRCRMIKIDVEGAELPIVRDVLARLHMFPETMELMVEVNPDDREGWEAAFDSLRSAGFKAWAIENRYDIKWYLEWQEAPLVEVDALPAQMADLFFSRQFR